MIMAQATSLDHIHHPLGGIACLTIMLHHITEHLFTLNQDIDVIFILPLLQFLQLGQDPTLLPENLENFIAKSIP